MAILSPVDNPYGISEPRLASGARDAIAVLIVFAVFAGVRYAGYLLTFPLGGPLATVAALVAVAVILKREGNGLASIGLQRPAPASRALVMFLLAFGVTALAGLVLLGYLQGVFGTPAVTGRFDYLQGNPLALVLSVTGIAWFAAAFAEEVVWRGFTIPRLASAFGGSSTAWLVAVVLQALVFGLLHSGTAGMIVAGVIGLGYGLIFWLGMRNLWPLIITHAIPDTISLIGIYQGD